MGKLRRKPGSQIFVVVGLDVHQLLSSMEAHLT